MTYTLGIIKGGGTGPELISVLKELIYEVENLYGLNYRLVEFDDKKFEKEVEEEKWNANLYSALYEFYNYIKKENGHIIRGSLPAPILYKLRERMNFIAKIVPLNPYPMISIEPSLDVLLIRENNSGIYHSSLSSYDFEKGVVHMCVEYKEENIKYLAQLAFREALKRKKKVSLILKTSVLKDLGELWERILEEEHNTYKEVEYVIRPSGAGFSDMYLFPHQFDVVITDDEGGDIISDVVPTFLYKSRNLNPSVDLDKDGFYIYQTNHGTVKVLKGKNKINPIAMITAYALSFKYSLNYVEIYNDLINAVNITLEEGFRTEDIYDPTNNKHKIVTTTQMVEKILDNLRKLREYNQKGFSCTYYNNHIAAPNGFVQQNDVAKIKASLGSKP